MPAADTRVSSRVRTKLPDLSSWICEIQAWCSECKPSYLVWAYLELALEEKIRDLSFFVPVLTAWVSLTLFRESETLIFEYGRYGYV